MEGNENWCLIGLPGASLSNLPHIHKWVFVVVSGPEIWGAGKWMSVWFGRVTSGRTAYPMYHNIPSETNRGPNMPTRSNPWDPGEVCCLPGVWVRDITKKFPSLLWPTDYYLLLVFQVGSIKKALDNQERPQGLETVGWGTWSTYCVLFWAANEHFTFWNWIFCLKQVFNSHQKFKEMACHAHIYSTGLFLPVWNKKEKFCLWEQTFLILCGWKLVKK